jgi:peptidoglycan/LPS O-acetylase OafA/YrhL
LRLGKQDMTAAIVVRDPENFSAPLHALRGLAALVVLLAHAWIPVAHFGSPTAFFLSLFNSGSAVSLFFVLSGLVLALSFERSPPDNLFGYAKYAIRRAFRLLPLLALTVVI